MDKGKFFNFKENPNIKTLLMIIAINKESPWWDKTITYAKNCPWTPGKRLADRMTKNDFKDWEKIFIAIHNEDFKKSPILNRWLGLPINFLKLLYNAKMAVQLLNFALPFILNFELNPTILNP